MELACLKSKVAAAVITKKLSKRSSDELMIKIHYFASIREQLNQAEEQLTLPEGVSSIDQLIQHLQSINPSFKSVMDSRKKILVAVNQTVVDRSYELSEDDEVAFFPPMTGG